MKKYLDLFNELTAKGVDLSDYNRVQFEIITKVGEPELVKTDYGLEGHTVHEFTKFRYIVQAIVSGVVVTESRSEGFDSRFLLDYATLTSDRILWRMKAKEEVREKCTEVAWRTLAVLEVIFWEKQLSPQQTA